MIIERRIFVLGISCLLVVCAAPATAQRLVGERDQEIDRIRTLYVAAAYEEALAAMPLPGGDPLRIDLEQYRALCLIALGREAEAVAAVERLVNDDPMYVPPASDTSPRMQSMFAAARSKLVPPLAKREYTEAKASYEAKKGDAARAGFQRTLDLIASLPDEDKGSLADLRLLAAEFRDLAATRTAPPPAAAPERESAAAKPEPRAEVEYVPPVAIREKLPAWIPPTGDAMRATYIGVLRVFIGEDGRVAQATLVKTSHPAYDAAALDAAKQWLYKPATKGGKPVPAERDIQVRLLPR